jgi:hypothetical protein
MLRYGCENYLSNKSIIDFKSGCENGHRDSEPGPPVLGEEEGGFGGESVTETL